MGRQISPFSNGSQYTDWKANNCDKCAWTCGIWGGGWYPDATCEAECEIDTAGAMFGSGEISGRIATKIGYFQNRRELGGCGAYTWPCPLFQEENSLDCWGLEAIYSKKRIMEARNG